MVQDKVKVTNKSGLHARPATLLTQKAGKYEAEITIVHNNREANAKSILNVMALGASCGSEITIKVDGKNEEEVLKEIKGFIKSGMGEEE